jgi:protein-S-isoprenylcysteine O-methyltransferase Ste14
MMMRWLENRLPPPAVALVIALGMGVVAWTTPGMALPDGVRFGAVAVLLVFAGLMAGRAIRAFARVGTTINPVNIDAASILVTSGVYRISRNPMYVGLTSVLAALGVGLASGWALVGPVLFVLFITRFQIIPEERVMQAKFGSGYSAYRDSVRRWL